MENPLHYVNMTSVPNLEKIIPHADVTDPSPQSKATETGMGINKNCKNRF